MNASNDNTSWWNNPPRSGPHRLIAPYEYRHLRFFGATHIAGGAIATGAGLICLAYHAYGWAGLFLAIGAAHIAGGYWYLTIDRSASAQA